MKRILLFLAALPAFGQLTTTQTTFSSAITSLSTVRVTLASATGVAVKGVGNTGSYLFADGEAMQVLSLAVSPATYNVVRGALGTKPGLHSTAAIVYVGQPAASSGDLSRPFTSGALIPTDPPYGACTASLQYTLPLVNYTAARVWNCLNSQWTLISSPTGGGGNSGATWLWQSAYQAGATGTAFNLPAASAPSLTSTGGTVPIGVLEWPTAQSTYYAWVTAILPSSYTANGTLTYALESKCNTASCDSTNANIVTLSLACSSTVDDNPSFGAASPFNVISAAAGAPTMTSGTLVPNTGSLPTCAASQRMWIKIVVDTNTNSATGGFDVASFRVTTGSSL